MKRLVLIFVLCLVPAAAVRAQNAAIEFKDGDRVVFLGSTLLERAQRFGYLETELIRLRPDRNIIFRNLAWSGDTVAGDSWVYATSHSDHTLRGEQLHAVVAEQKPTTIIVGYGAVEAFDGEAGRERWRSGLKAMLDRLGPTGARLILMTSPPQEAVRSKSAPVYNRNLVLYMEDMKAIAADRKLPVIDLGARVAKYQADHPDAALTDNGMQYGQSGYRTLAGLFVQALGWPTRSWSASVDAKSLRIEGTSNATGDIVRTEDRLSFSLKDATLPQPPLEGAQPGSDGARILKISGLTEGRYTLYADGTEVLTTDAADFEKGINLATGPAFDRAEELRKAVVEKDRLFFNFWRPENETYLKGFRRREQGRNVVELPLFDPLIAKQEQEIVRLKQPETNFYHLIPAAPASRRGPATVPDPDWRKELASFEIAEGFEVTPFATDPMIISPTCMNWDSRGRLWVASSQIYPQLRPGEKANDKIIILEDLDGDGRADKRTVFAEGLLVPTSVLPGDGGAYVANSTELLHLTDTDGDGRADHTRVVLSGFGTEDTHQILHAFRWAPGGRMHFNQSVLIHSHVETPQGVRRLPGGGIWEFDTRDGSLDVYLRGMVNPWGIQYDRWGQSFATDGAHGEGIYYAWPGAAYFWARGVPRILKGMNPGQPKECGLEIASGRHLPEAWQGRLLTADFRAHRIVSFALSESNSGFFSKQTDDLIKSDHVAFRPVDIKMGPDGAIYICDWYNPIINHGEVDFRDPRRDHQHGRIWRVTAKGRPTLKNPQLGEAAVAGLLEALKSPEQWTRDIARQELKNRDRGEVVASLPSWVASLDRKDADFEHQRLEALWAFETVGAVPPAYLKELLHTGDHRVRAASVRVLSHVRESVPDAPALLEETVIDDHPRVRLESINALRAVGTLSAFEAALRALDHPMDELIDYALWGTVRELESVWLPAFEAGRLSFGGNAGRVAFVLAASGKASILGPLVQRFRQEELQGEIRDKVAELIAAAGSPSDLRVLLDRALTEKNTTERAVLMNHLVAAARDRRIKPEGELALSTDLLAEEPAAVALAGLWKLPAARPALNSLATDAKSAASARAAAIAALADLGGDESLATLTGLASAEQSSAIRARAVAAMTSLDTRKAAAAAVEALPALAPTDASAVFDAFLHKTDGPAVLAEGLKGRRLSPEIVSIGINEASTLGARARPLVEALTAAGSASATRANLPPAEWSALLAEVTTRGVAAKGEAVYRRNALGCVKCHAIGGAGGKVGPDLMSLGASAPLDYIAESLVDPSRKIKEGYETTVVILDDGKVLTGTVIGEVGDHFLMRNAGNVVLKIPKKQVEEKVVQTASLMPTGITDPLSRNDFVDLVRFLSEIGKSPGFQVPTRETVRVWQTLQASAPITAADLAKGPITGTNWSPAFSRVGGSLPLDETAAVKVGAATKHVVRFQVDVHKAGKVGLKFDGGGTIEAWIDGKSVSVSAQTVTAELSTGPHGVMLAIPSGSAANQVRVERLDLPDSAAQSSFQLEL